MAKFFESDSETEELGVPNVVLHTSHMSLHLKFSGS